jgi:serine/threonine-protein kinase
VNSPPDPGRSGDFGPGTRIDRYEIARCVASGGMGRVWLARFAGKHGFEKQVAIKTILPELAAAPHYRKMFLDEARLCARLAHANVAQILDVGEHEGTLYIVFEWVEGHSLEQLCGLAEARGETLAIGPLLRVMAEVCSGLHAAHELTDDHGRPLGVVHRDVTPNNVIVSDKGYAKLIDFGVAKAKGRTAGETSSGVVKGTPQYMAPEQARGDPVDRRCDVWAAGAVLYRALAGAAPFADRAALEAFIRKRSEPAELPRHVPAAVRELVAQAMQRDPAERFAGADELRFAVERVLGALGSRRSIADLFPPSASSRAPETPTASLEGARRAPAASDAPEESDGSGSGPSRAFEGAALPFAATWQAPAVVAESRVALAPNDLGAARSRRADPNDLGAAPHAKTLASPPEAAAKNDAVRMPSGPSAGIRRTSVSRAALRRQKVALVAAVLLAVAAVSTLAWMLVASWRA